MKPLWASAALALAVFFASLRPLQAETLFRFPAIDPQGRLFMEAPIIGVDDDEQHDKNDPITCTNYAGEHFPYCYNDHLGSDFLLSGGFTTMDQGVPVVASADAVVVEVIDGNYDRCHSTTNFEVSCDGYPMIANRVVLRHADGLRSGYWHLKKGSIQVRVGDTVRCGQQVALVGSSGKSATPHVHFQLETGDGKIIDPFAGPRSQPASYWVEQDGRFKRPGDRCQGEALPTPDRGATADGGPAPVTASPGGLDRGPGSAAGCSALPLRASTGGGAESAATRGWLVLLLLLVLGRPARGRCYCRSARKP